MQITQTKNSDFMILEFNGNLDTQTAPDAEKIINQLIEDGESKFIFNFADTKYMSSSGLRVLLATAKKLKKKGELRISNLNSVIEEVFDISGFSSILNVYKTQEEALN